MKKTLFLILAVFILFSCNQSSNDSIKIAAVLSLTGPASNFGQEELKAIEIIKEDLAQKSYNNKYINNNTG